MKLGAIGAETLEKQKNYNYIISLRIFQDSMRSVVFVS